MRIALILMAATAILASATARDPSSETITYKMQSSGLCLACATYSLTLRSDGRGVFMGERNTIGIGPQSFEATPEQFRAFRNQLAPYRPNGERLMDQSPPCGPLSTDQDTVEVRWQYRTASARLVYYAGCDAEKNRKMAEALFTAARLLPIASFLPKR